jgi:hypothetical protein
VLVAVSAGDALVTVHTEIGLFWLTLVTIHHMAVPATTPLIGEAPAFLAMIEQVSRAAPLSAVPGDR